MMKDAFSKAVLIFMISTRFSLKRKRDGEKSQSAF